MIYKFLPLILMVSLSFVGKDTSSEIVEVKSITTDPKLVAENAKLSFAAKCKSFYQELVVEDYSLPNFESFAKAFEGYEQLKNQGKIEGILSVVNNAKPEENEISSIWHSGYYRGLNQVEDVRLMAYEDGYHRATEDGNCPAAIKAQKDALLSVPTTTEKPKLTKPNQEDPIKTPK